MSDLFADFFCGVPHFQLFYSRIYELSDLSEKKKQIFFEFALTSPAWPSRPSVWFWFVMQ